MKISFNKSFPFLIAMLCTVIVFSCGKERITVSPQIPMTSKYNGIDYPNSFSSICGSSLLQWSGSVGNALSTIETPEFSVTKGQNISCQSTSISNYDQICRTVTIECFVNNKSVGLFTKELGIKSISAPVQYCKDQVNSTVNFIIP
jgi:hypothetical protein